MLSEIVPTLSFLGTLVNDDRQMGPEMLQRIEGDPASTRGDGVCSRAPENVGDPSRDPIG